MSGRAAKEKTAMSPEKQKRLIVAMTAAGVLLVLFLVIVLVVQFVQIGVKNKQKSDYQQLLEKLEQDIGNGQNELDKLMDEGNLYYYAIMHGYITP